MTYTYGAATGTPHALRLENKTLKSRVVLLEDRAARLARALREAEYRSRGRTKRQDAAATIPYRNTLTPEELTAPPTLWPGDTPETCAARLQAINNDSNARARENSRAAQTRRDAA